MTNPSFLGKGKIRDLRPISDQNWQSSPAQLPEPVFSPITSCLKACWHFGMGLIQSINRKQDGIW